MRIEIDLSAADDPKSHAWLDRILDKIQDCWHVWDIEAGGSAQRYLATSWMRDEGRQGRRVRQTLVASMKNRGWISHLHGRRVRATLRPTGGHDMAPESVAQLAGKQLVILVENRFSDGAFIERVMTEVDKHLGKYWHLSDPPIHIDSVGGRGQMPREVKRRVEQFDYRPRLVVIADSDRRTVPPDGETLPDFASDQARKIADACRQLNVSCWILRKRTAENYLPDVLLEKMPDATPRHAELLRTWAVLNDDQKDIFDMKRGLGKMKSPSEVDAFHCLTEDQRSVLKLGFGKDVYKCWNFLGGQATPDMKAALAMRERGRGDLERGIALICREI